MCVSGPGFISNSSLNLNDFGNVLAVFGPPPLRGNSKPRMCGSGPLRGLRNAHVELGSTGGLHVWRKPTYMSSGQPAGCPRALRNPVSRPVPPTVWPSLTKWSLWSRFWSRLWSPPRRARLLLNACRTRFSRRPTCLAKAYIHVEWAARGRPAGPPKPSFETRSAHGMALRQGETTASEKLWVFTVLCFSHGFAVSFWFPARLSFYSLFRFWGLCVVALFAGAAREC